MERHSFDQLTRQLVGRPRTRRSAARIVGSALAGGLLGRGPAAPAGAACVALGKRCRKGDRCCDGRCQGGKCRCQGDRDCGALEYCGDGRCLAKRDLDRSCADDRECLSGICDRYTDSCAALRFACKPTGPTGQCWDGRCCPDGNVEPTGGYCAYDNATPTDFCVVCGACDHTLCCPPERCQNGDCCCPAGEPNCDSSLPVCVE